MAIACSLWCHTVVEIRKCKWPLTAMIWRRKSVRTEATALQLYLILKVVIRMFNFPSNSSEVGCSIDVPKAISRFALLTKDFLTLEKPVAASNSYGYFFYAHHFLLYLLPSTSSVSFQNSDPLVRNPPTITFFSGSTCPSQSSFWIFMYVFPLFETLLLSPYHPFLIQVTEEKTTFSRKL